MDQTGPTHASIKRGVADVEAGRISRLDLDTLDILPLDGYLIRDYEQAMAALREVRLARGISQTVLARKLGVVPSAVPQWELGHRNMRTPTLFTTLDILRLDTYLIPRRPEGGRD